MKETFPIEFLGGSQDGVVNDCENAPDVLLVSAGEGVQEIYKRKNDEPPFVYEQIGYATRETWK
jgi:hypothetical protein